MKQKILITSSLATGYIMLAATRVLAADPPDQPVAAGKVTCGALPQSWCNAGDLNTVIGYIITYLLGLVGIILAIVILISAIQYITSAGSPDRIKSAKDRLVQAAVSLGFLISFSAIVNVVNTTVFKGVTGTKLSEVQTLGSNVVTLLLGIVGVLAVIFIIIGGIQYTMSAGDPNKVSQAKSTITYAIIGLVMALSIGVIISLVNALAK